MRKFSPGTENLEKSVNWLEEHCQHWNYQETLLTSAEPSLPLNFHLTNKDASRRNTLFLVSQSRLCFFLGVLLSLCLSTYYLGTREWVLIKKIRNILWTESHSLSWEHLGHSYCMSRFTCALPAHPCTVTSASSQKVQMCLGYAQRSCKGEHILPQPVGLERSSSQVWSDLSPD